MGRRIVVKRAGARRGSSLDLPMALLAALAVGFVAYAMPAALLADAVGATGLPTLLPAAQPPLGTTARLSVVFAGAAGVFLATWLLLRALGGRARIRIRREAEEILAPPRLRRADYHPDAPEPRPFRIDLVLDEPQTTDEPAEAVAPEPFDEYYPCTGSVEPAEIIVVADEPPSPPSTPALDLEVPTIGELMRRLEAGLAQRQPPAAPAPRPVESSRQAPITANDVDERLRGALDELQKLVARSA